MELDLPGFRARITWIRGQIHPDAGILILSGKGEDAALGRGFLQRPQIWAGMKIEELMTKATATCRSGHSLCKAAKMMWDNVLGEDGLLDSLHALGDSTPVPRRKSQATVLPFKSRGKGNGNGS